METFSALLALCAGNSPITKEFPSQRPVTRSFDVLFDRRLNKRLSKQPWGWWFEMPSRSLWRHCNDTHELRDYHWHVEFFVQTWTVICIFIPFIHTEMSQMVEIFPRHRKQQLHILYSQYRRCGNAMNLGISSHGIVLVCPDYFYHLAELTNIRFFGGVFVHNFYIFPVSFINSFRPSDA